MQVQPYLDFGGRFDEAMAFYGKVMGAKVTFLMRYKEAPEGQPQPSAAWADKVMHANIQIGDSQIMASDGREGQTPAFSGFMMSVGDVPNAECRRPADLQRAGRRWPGIHAVSENVLGRGLRDACRQVRHDVDGELRALMQDE